MIGKQRTLAASPIADRPLDTVVETEVVVKVKILKLSDTVKMTGPTSVPP